MLKRILNIIGSNFTAFILLSLLAVKYFFDHLAHEAIFKKIAIYILFAAAIHFVLIIITHLLADPDKSIQQNKTRFTGKLLNIFVKSGLISTIILFSAFHFYVIIYSWDWTFSIIYVSVMIVVMELKSYFKKRKPAGDPEITDN